MSKQYYFAEEHIFTSRGSGVITLKAGAGETLLVEGLDSNLTSKSYFNMHAVGGLTAIAGVVINTYTKLLMAVDHGTIGLKTTDFTATDRGVVTYSGSTSKKFLICVDISSLISVASLCIFGVGFNNASPSAVSEQSIQLGTGSNWRGVSLRFMATLATSDYFQVWVRNNTTDSTTIQASYFTITATEV